MVIRTSIHLLVLQSVGDFERLALALGTGGGGISLALGPGLDKAAPELALSGHGGGGEVAFAFAGKEGWGFGGEAAALHKASFKGARGSLGSRLCASSTALS